MSIKGIFNAAKKKASRVREAIIAFYSTITAFAFCQLNAFALSIDTNYTIKSSVAKLNPESLVLGVSFWICRLIGIGMFIWGLYGYVTARRGGDSEAMNSAMNTLIGGLILLCMPTILTSIGVI